MALQMKTGNFAKSTGGAPAAQDVEVGFVPKALLLWCTPQTANNTFGAGQYFCFGAATRRSGATQERCIMGLSDQAATTNTWQDMRAAVLAISDTGAGTLRAVATLVDFDVVNGGFSLSWTTNNATAYVIHYLAIGGDDLTDAFVDDMLLGTGTGNVSETGVGFQGDAAIFFGINSAAVLPVADATDAGMGIGFATSATQRGTWAMGSRDARTEITTRGTTQRIDRCYRSFTRATLDQSCDFVSFNSDGFTVTKVAADVATPVSKRMGYLILKGGRWKADNFAKVSSATPQTQAETGVGWTPVGVMFGSWNRVANTAVVTSADKRMIGAMTGATEESLISTALTALNNEDEVQQNSKCIMTQNSGAMVSEAEFSSFDADGFTVNWTTTTASADEFFYLAGASNAPKAPRPFRRPMRPYQQQMRY